MVRSDANSVTVRVSGAESSYGTAPAGAYDALRFNSESLTGDASFTRSDEITNTGTTKAIILNGRNSGGEITTDLYYDGDVNTEGAADKLWLLGLQTGLSNPWASLPTGIAGVDAAATGNKFTASGLDGSFAIGDWIHAEGSAVAGNNKIFVETAENTDEITVAGATLADDSSSGITLQKFVFIENGTTLETVSIEKQFGDQTTDDFHLYRGCAVSGIRVQGQVGGIATQTFSLVGKGLETGDIGDTTAAGSSVAASTNDPYNVVDHLGVSMEGGANTGLLTPGSFEINIQRALRPQQVMGQAGAVGVGNGSMTITGSYTMFYEDATELEKFLANSASEVAFGFFDGTRGWLLLLPAIKYTSAETVAGSKDSDIIVNLGFEAYEDPNNAGRMIRVGKSQ